MSLADAIATAASGREVPGNVLEAGFGEIMDGKATSAQIAALLVALRTKGETVAEIVEGGGEAVAYECDITEEAQCEAMVATAASQLGRIDVLHSNVGIGTHDGSPTRITEEGLDIMLDVNLKGLIFTCKHAIPVMGPQGSGSIINVGSAFGVVASGRIPNASYGSSKAALHQLSRELASQWGSRGVRVNALIPGWFPSELTNALLQSKSWLEWIRANTPVDRVGEEHELDGALLFLASDASTFMTGQLLVVDGGWSLGSPTALPGPLGRRS